MQPEEIIQRKEWLQLTAEEKKILEPLAADKQEFNLLKKMLLVADEVSTDVPMVAPVLQEQLSRSVKRNDRLRADRKIWYYAAATIVLVAVAAWFYLRTDPDKKTEIVTTPSAINADSPIVVKSPIETAKEFLKPEDSIPLAEVAITKGKSNSPETKKPISQPDDINNNQAITFVKTSILIKDNSEFMSLVTEVY